MRMYKLFSQETKKEVINKELCFTLWGDLEVTWEMIPSIILARVDSSFFGVKRLFT